MTGTNDENVFTKDQLEFQFNWQSTSYPLELTKQKMLKTTRAEFLMKGPSNGHFK